MAVDPGHNNKDQNLAVILYLIPNILLQQRNTTPPSPNIKIINILLNGNYSCASQHHQKITRAPPKVQDRWEPLVDIFTSRQMHRNLYYYYFCILRSYIQEEDLGDASLRAQRQINAQRPANTEEQVEVEEINSLFIARARGLLRDPTNLIAALLPNLGLQVKSLHTVLHKKQHPYLLWDSGLLFLFLEY